MDAQKWDCEGCGTTSLHITNHEYKRRPVCLYCGSKEAMTNKGIVDIEIREKSIFGIDVTRYYKK